MTASIGRTVPQAGAIAVRRANSEPEFLIVTAKRDPSAWIFPKGHLEAFEAPEDAAIRELMEEAGVAGTLIGRVGSSRFRSGTEDVDVTYFLVVASNDGASREGRELRWLNYDAASSQLSFTDTRDLLAKARDMLEAER